jgi:hypothetical protein
MGPTFPPTGGPSMRETAVQSEIDEHQYTIKTIVITGDSNMNALVNRTVLD